MGPFESAIRNKVSIGSELHTPAQGKPFEVGVIDSDGLVLLLGAKRAHTRFTWQVIEGINSEFDHKGWIELGGSYDANGRPGTLDAYLKQSVHRNTASWMAALLEAAGLIEIDRSTPCQMRLV